MTEDHWLKTRDSAHMDEEGFLTLSGRSSDLIKLVDDDQVNVTPMEQRVRLELACVAQCVIVPSTARDKLGVILTLDTIADSNNSLCLSQSAVNWFKNSRFDVKTVSDVVTNMESGIKHVIQVSGGNIIRIIELITKFRNQLKDPDFADDVEEIKQDIAGLKKRKVDLAQTLGY